MKFFHVLENTTLSLNALRVWDTSATYRRKVTKYFYKKKCATNILLPRSFGFLLASRISINNWRSLLFIFQEIKENNKVEFTQNLLRHIPNHSYNLFKGPSLYLGKKGKNMNTKYKMKYPLLRHSIVWRKKTWSPLCIVIVIDRYECIDHSNDLESVGFLRPWIKVFRYYFYKEIFSTLN